MERNILIQIEELNCDLTFVCHSDNLFTITKRRSFWKRFGQCESVVVAKVNLEWWIVSGDEFIEMLKDDGVKNGYGIFCNSLGELTWDEYLAARLLLTVKDHRLNYIDIAKAVQQHSQPDKLPNITTLDRDDIEKYKQLLTFDWDAFLKAPVNPSQIKMFEDER